MIDQTNKMLADLEEAFMKERPFSEVASSQQTLRDLQAMEKRDLIELVQNLAAQFDSHIREVRQASIELCREIDQEYQNNLKDLEEDFSIRLHELEKSSHKQLKEHFAVIEKDQRKTEDALQKWSDSLVKNLKKLST